jgi:2-polyprenyl-3-methyl-5-hydroxy-6-metoxy-1,4-benzoquinol methylase
MTTIKEVRDFWDGRPCNIRHSNKELGSKEYFKEVTNKKYFVEPHIIPFANFSEWKGKKVLEIGCGLGTASQSFAEAGAIYTGVDISQTSLDLARKRFEVFGLEGTFYKVDGEDISSVVPIEDYDLVYSFGVIHHTPNPQKLLSEVKKYMNKDSVLRIMLYASSSWKAYMIEAGLDQPEAQRGCPIANTYTKSEVVELLNEFLVTKIEQDHIFPYEVSSYKNQQYTMEEWFKCMPSKMFSTLQKNLGWHLLIEARTK